MAFTGITTLPESAGVDDVVECLERDGAVIIENMLSNSTLDAFWADIGPQLHATGFGEDGFAGTRTRRCSGLMGKSVHTADMLTQKHFLGAAEKMIPQPYTWVNGETSMELMPTMQLNFTQAIQIWPGQAAQVVHRDDALHHRRHPGPDSSIQILYAGTRFTKENGATLVIPGSHKWDDDRRPKMEETVQAVMNKGSGLVYLGSTYHGGGPNTTADETRTAIGLALTLGYLRQEENQYLVVPLEMVKKYPKKVQDLLGYAACPPFCGWVEMQEPRVVLERDDWVNAGAKNIY
jgi:ectoine hydroxylase-related dioxygenase (phytanoyl-CoA dioxygenase family)